MRRVIRVTGCAVTGPGQAGDEQAVRLVGVSKSYGPRHSRFAALNGVTVSFRQAAFTAIMGPSGSGKSTLLQCAAGLDRPRRCARRRWTAGR
jgi:ABC-type lipoprotein export system ATPase subunit